MYGIDQIVTDSRPPRATHTRDVMSLSRVIRRFLTAPLVALGTMAGATTLPTIATALARGTY